MTVMQETESKSAERPRDVGLALRYGEKLAPFIDISDLSKKDELLHIGQLSAYIQDPYTARHLQRRQYGTDDGYSGEWDAGYENAMSAETRNALDELAANGKTFMAQALAEGIVSSPLGRIFDRRSERVFDLVSRQEMLHSIVQVSKRELKTERAFEQFITKLAETRDLDPKELSNDPQYLAYLERRNVYNAFI